MGILDGWRFCPRCAAFGTNRGSSFTCSGCGYVAWANSIPGVHALIERDGEVLLGRRAYEPGAGCWGLPGGFLEEGEDSHAGLQREVREETGLEIEVRQLHGTWVQPHGERYVLCLVWRAAVVGGVEHPADDVTALAWFHRDALPDDVGPSAFAKALSVWRHEDA